MSQHFIANIIFQDLQDKKYPIVHTRFPPEPNGYLHIGHAKAICLNFGMAQKFNGFCNLRLDDTNPEKESAEYAQAIAQDVSWLGFKWQGEIKQTSSYFSILHDCAVELIEKGLAYVCFLTAEDTRKYRGTLTEVGTNSPYRNSSVSENLANFSKMKNGQYKEGECVLRAKIDMSSPFMCMRDPTIYRIKYSHHQQTQGQWCIYPMYDFAHCISDAIENISHSLCTLEFQDNRRVYDWFLDNLSIGIAPRPYQFEFARLNLEHTIMSKRLLQQLVNNNLVNGWDDPRMPTISGMRRRGYPPEAIVDFCNKIGVSKQDSLIPMDVLENTVRDYLNANAHRAMAVLNPVKIIIENFQGEPIKLQAPNHPQNQSFGKRDIYFSKTLFIEQEDFKLEANRKYKRLVLGKEVRLRNAYVIKAERVEQDSTGKISAIYCSYDPETLGKNPQDGRKVNGVIHFVEATTAIEAEFHLYDRLFLEKDPSKLEDFTSAFNHDSNIVKQGFLEASLKTSVTGSTFQFERLGYFCRDISKDNLVFNQTVSLRSTW